MGPQRDLDERVNIEADPEDALRALLQVDPSDEDQDEDGEPDE